MKAKKILAILSALTIGASLCAFAACGDPDDSGNNPPDDNKPPVVTPPGGNDPTEPDVVYGLPAAEEGHYIKDSDLVQDGEVRYLVYTTNESSGEEDNVIAVRKATYTEGEGKGWAYGEEHIAISYGEEGDWDEYIGSASITKGEFGLEGETYNWLIAYCGTTQANDTQYQIGLAVAKTPDGEWTKVSETPLVEFDGDVYGSTSVGCYAPSLVNLDKESTVRLFYTYADIYGHFARFYDFDASDLSSIDLSGINQCPTNGDYEGEAKLFPNADFAYDAENGTVYAVKDHESSHANVPYFAYILQFLQIDEEELYTTELGDGWQTVRQWDNMDTPETSYGTYERLYGACIVSDAYGHILNDAVEIVYNVCDIASENEDYLFSQHLETFNVTL